ncbi:hypothetical protein FISHEDRAFT_12882, partial [Fistulina hepatica ATCC 64428]
DSPPTSISAHPSSHPTPVLTRSTRIPKPSCYIRELNAGLYTTTGTSRAPPLPTGICPTPQPPLTKDESEDQNDSLVLMSTMANTETLKPHSLAEAKQQPEWPNWEQAIHEELANLADHDTWDIVNTPPH